MKIREYLRRLFCKQRAPVPTPEPEPPAPAVPEQEHVPCPDYRDPVYLRLAKECAMGDIVSMMEMARWHRGYLRPGTEAMLAAYESGEDTSGLLYERMRYGSPDRFSLKAYNTWVCQAARYGHAGAQALSRDSYLFQNGGVLKAETHNVGKFGSEHYYASDLNQLGLLDIDSGYSEFGMYSLLPEGIFMAYYQSGYIPADSDGFGREDDYEDVFYDEFFNHIPGKTLEDARKNLPRLLKKREDYWKDPVHDRENRMYKCLLSNPGENKL